MSAALPQRISLRLRRLIQHRLPATVATATRADRWEKTIHPRTALFAKVERDIPLARRSCVKAAGALVE
jgi:hypothetical protein